MGNLCGKQSSDNFDQPGRVLGSASAQPNNNARASIPSKVTASTPGRTLGGGGTAPEGGSGDPRSAAAKAAEERAKKAQSPTGKGKLASQLEAQRKQTRSETLDQVSRENRGARDADSNAQARNWN